MSIVPLAHWAYVVASDEEGLAWRSYTTPLRSLINDGTHTIILYVDAQSLTGATHLYECAGMHVALLDHQYQKELRAGKELSTQTISE